MSERETDQELLAAWKNGDRERGNRLFSRHVRSISTFFRSKLAEGAEDLTQRTFLALVEQADRFRGDSSVRTYLFGIARKQLLMHLRSLTTERKRFVLPALQRFGPDLIIVGNGPDPGQFDPNGRQIVTMAGFNTLARRARAAADRLCGGRLLVVQEGGYNPAYAAYCLHATAEGFLDLPCGLADPLAFMPEPDARVEADIAALAERLAASGWRFDP